MKIKLGDIYKWKWDNEEVLLKVIEINTQKLWRSKAEVIKVLSGRMYRVGYISIGWNLTEEDESVTFIRRSLKIKSVKSI